MLFRRRRPAEASPPPGPHRSIVGNRAQEAAAQTAVLPEWLRLAWRVSRRESLLILLLSVGAALLAALQPLPLKLLIDHALGPAPAPPLLRLLLPPALQGSTALIVLAALAALALALLASALDARLLLAWASVGQGSALALSEQLYAQLLALPPRFHQRLPLGDRLQRLLVDSYSMYSAAEQLLVSPARQLLTLAAIALVAWQLDAGLTLLTFTVVPPLVLLARRARRPLQQRLRDLRETEAQLLSFTHQTLAALPVVQAFQQENRNRHRFAALSAEAVSRTRRQQLMHSLLQLGGGVVGSLATAVVLAVGSRRVLAGDLGVGSLVVLLGYLSTIQACLMNLLEAFAARQTILAGLERVKEVLASDERLPEPALPQPLPGGRARGRIRFEGVRLRHPELQSQAAAGGAMPERRPGMAAPALDGLSLTIEPGETVALVGPTGSGKSSLVGCLLRWFDPDAGRILLDEVDIRTLPLHTLRDQLAFVPQQPLLAPLTVAETIAYADPGAPRSRIERAARLADAAAFIQRLPGGYDARLGERGASLSGGERQRLALARALCRPTPILLLDEPTAALDASTEQHILDALERLQADGSQRRTILLVTHRLTSARRADRIVMLERGRIVEQGPPALLLSGDGPTARLLRSTAQPAADSP